MNYNNPQSMTIVGVPTPKGVIFKSESQKLHQAFPVAANVTIIEGMPVGLKTDGTIEPFVGANPTSIYLGIAITNNQYPAYPQNNEVTVMVEGFAIIYGVAAAALNAGSVKPSVLAADSQYVTYAADTANTNPKFLALNTASAANDTLQILVR